MRRVLLSILWVWLAVGLPLKAQSPELFFSRLTGGNYLSSQYVTAMAQDQFGYLWIGTQDGMNRYDGHEIKTYRSLNRNLIDGFVGSLVEHLVVDGQNRVWAATSHGLSLYNWVYDCFEVVVSLEDFRGLPGNYLTFLYVSPGGDFMVGYGDGIYRYNGEEEKFELVFTSPLGAVSAFLIDQSGAWWLGHHGGQGIICYPDPSDSTEFNYYQQELIGEKADYSVMAIQETEAYIWAALENAGVARIEPEQHKVKRYFENGRERYFFDLFTDFQGRLWSSDYSGVKLYIPESDSFYGYYHQANELGTLATGLNGVFVDNQGHVYSYHHGDGVLVAYNNRGFSGFSSHERHFWHTAEPNISAIHEDIEGNLWLGFFNGGLNIFMWKEGTTLHFPPGDGTKNTEMGPGSVLSLYRDSKGRMWIGSHTGGLHLYNAEKREFEVWREGFTIDAPSHNDIRSIVEDGKGNLWLGLHGGGVDLFDPEQKSFKNYNQRNNGLSSDWVFKVLVDHKGNLWVGTAHGLNLLKPGEERFEVTLADPELEGGLKGNQFITMLEDKRGLLWFGTNNGLYLRNEEGQFIRYAEEMASQLISSIEEDGDGSLWIATLNGLYCLNTDTRILRGFDEVDGLYSPGFNINASYYNGIDQLFFCSPQGVNNFNPKEIRYNLNPPPMRFSGLKVFNETMDKYGEDQLLKGELNSLEELVLGYDQKFFSIEFVALNFFNPSKNRYACKLEGFDADWIDLGNQRTVSYTNLYPGTYVLRVVAANNDGIWNEEGLTLKIIILSPWWMRWWALSLYFGLLILLIYSLFRYRTRQLHKQKIILETRVADQTERLRLQNSSLKRRTEDLEEANYLLEERRELIGEQARKLEEQAEELTVSNEQLMKHIQTKDKLYSIVAHDLRAPFNTIMGFASLLSDAGEEADKEKVRMYARYINDAALQVFNLLENLLFWARSQSDEIQYSPSVLNLSELIREVMDLLSDSALKKSVSLHKHLEADLMVYADENMLHTILRNLLMNSLKFTDEGGEVHVECFEEAERVRVCVVDTGIGMDEETIKKLQTDQNFSSVGTGGEKGSGLGLMLCRDFIKRHGGSLEIFSTPGKGSRFCFTLPLTI